MNSYSSKLLEGYGSINLDAQLWQPGIQQLKNLMKISEKLVVRILICLAL